MLRCLRSTLSLEVEEISLQVCGRCCYVATSVRDPRAILCGNVEAFGAATVACANVLGGKYAVHWGAQTGCRSLRFLI
ncbi:unnamed protein product [Sphagnum jensenii]|uniref:Uncharacterized protein n=1 Tax=Sphagnum jensenii TaxID=128206 RepID=A0ABP0WAS7_9BRYO